ncbi:MAG: tetratricopeptide repeat protein [Lentisphaerae bacterium]|nr:tetratricopeptide repeat protein [Lentisphaerota bacterium]
MSGVAGLAAFAVQARALLCGFVYDDHVDIRAVDAVFTAGGWKDLLFSGSAELYRPAKYLSYHLDWLVWGWRPFGFHATSLLLHAIVAVLVWRLLYRVLRGRAGATAGALWFALHPVHVEAVTWVSARGSLLCAAAVLGLAWLYLSAGRRRGGWFWAGWTVLSGLAVFSREDALMFPAALIVMELWVRRERGERPRAVARRLVPCLAVFGLAAGVYLLQRFRIVDSVSQGAWPHGVTGLVSTLPVILVRYLGNLVYPVTLAADLPVDYAAGFGWMFSLATLVAAGLGVLILMPRALPGPLRFGLVWFVIFLIPVLGIVPINQPMADRFLYLPSAGIALLLAWAVRRVGRVRVWVRVLCWAALALWLAALAGRTWAYTGVWRTDRSLWTHVRTVNPASYRAWNNLAVLANNRGDWAEAAALARQALERRPDYPSAWIALGYALAGMGEPDEAESWYRRALSAVPGNAVWWRLLADLKARQGEREEARALYETRVLRLRPGFVAARLEAADLALEQGDVDGAKAHWRVVLEAEPGNRVARHNLRVAERGK